MKYNLLTGLVISEQDYQHCQVYPIYGTGQGSTASPVIWVVILNNLIELKITLCEITKTVILINLDLYKLWD